MIARAKEIFFGGRNKNRGKIFLHTKCSSQAKKIKINQERSFENFGSMKLKSNFVILYPSDCIGWKFQKKTKKKLENIHTVKNLRRPGKLFKLLKQK